MSSQSSTFQSACRASVAAGITDIGPARASLITAVSGTLRHWQARAAQRAQLAALENHRLKDIGVSRAAAAREAAKPFWRA